MSESADERDSDQATGIDDEQLPEDVRPGDDNPLAEPLDPDDEATKDLDELDMDATQDDSGAASTPGEPASEESSAENSHE